jgi:ABC-type lipoprotein release transport system permease subunit
MWKRFWPDEASAVGQTFRPWSGGPVTTVTGVITDIPMEIRDIPMAHFYIPYSSHTIGWITLAIGVKDDSAAMVKQVGEALAAVWPNPHPPQPYPIIQQVRDSRSELVASSKVMLWVAILAGAITAIGIYSFSAFTAAQSVRDSAIRMALGARPGNILRVHVIRYRWGVLAGLAAGIGLSLAAGPLLQRLDITLQPLETATIAVAGSLLVIIALVGLCLPLRGLRRLDIREILMGE